MSAFAAEQWRVLSPYLDEALEISPEERVAWLKSLSEENPELATNLQTLLKEYEALGEQGFLKTTAAWPSIPAALVGQTLGAYTLLSAIGQGGMGTVWLARRSDGRFEGKAAVKFLNLGLVAGAAEERFKREGTILARLAHPHIAHLIDAGVASGGQPYLILEYVDGKPIDTYCSEHRLDTEASIRLFLDVLAAVAHAHSNLIVHRDIKPSNVLVTADGKVKLLDFGIAKLLEDDAATAATQLTREGQRALTLAYAAPEQITGATVTTATDVYALGVLLHLLLAGKHPAESALSSPLQLIKAIVDTQPPRVSDVAPQSEKIKRSLRGDLDLIVAKALKKLPAERYPSVTAFAEDLHRYLGHQTVSARPDTLTYRARKFVARHRGAVALASAALVATAAGVVSALLEARSARLERDFALRQLSRAESINDLNAFVLSDAAPSGKPFTVNDLLARAERLVERQRGQDENRVELLISIGRQYTVQDEYGKARQLLAKAHLLAQDLPQRSTRARASCALAQALTRESEAQRAEGLIQAGLNELPKDARFAIDRVFCLQRGSEVAGNRGDSNQALLRAQQAQLALREAPFRSELLELDGLITLAGAYQEAGRVREATAAFEQAAAGLAALGRDDTQRAGTLFNNWGIALWLWGRPLDAERLLRRAIAVGQDSSDETTVSPTLLVNYARALNELSRLEEAADYAERGFAKAQAGGDQSALGQSLILRAAIYRGQGNLERAEQMLAELEPILRRNLPPGHIAFGSLASQQALNAQARHERQNAVDLASRAVAIAEASLKQGHMGAAYLERFLITRSEAELQLGQPVEAATDAARALKMLLEASQPGSLSSNVGRAYWTLGRALGAQGKSEEAQSALRSALENLQSALGSDHVETQAARRLVGVPNPPR